MIHISDKILVKKKKIFHRESQVNKIYQFCDFFNFMRYVVWTKTNIYLQKHVLSTFSDKLQLRSNFTIYCKTHISFDAHVTIHQLKFWKWKTKKQLYFKIRSNIQPNENLTKLFKCSTFNIRMTFSITQW